MKSNSSKCNSKSDEGKSKDHHMDLMSSVAEIHRVAQANQQRLHLLELAIANLTSICSTLRHDLDPGKVQAEAIDMKPPFSRSPSPSLESKDDSLGARMQQLVEQAAALGILKEAKTSHSKFSGNTQENSKASMKPNPENMQAPNNQKRSTTRFIQTAVSTTEKKMSMKLGMTKNMEAARPKPPSKIPGNNIKATPTPKLSLKSTVKETKTTISDIYVESVNKSGKELASGNGLVKSSARNAVIRKDKGSIKSTISTNQSDTWEISASHALTVSSLPSGPPTIVKSDLKPRRKWNTTKELTSD